MEQWCKSLANILSDPAAASKFKSSSRELRSRAVALVTVKNPVCSLNHILAWCEQFKSWLTPASLRSKRLASTVSGQDTEPRSRSCRQCKEKYHTLLHVAKKLNKTQKTGNSEREAIAIPQTSYSAYCNDETERIMLSTAILYILDSKSGRHECQALLDQGSQSSKPREAPPPPQFTVSNGHFRYRGHWREWSGTQYDPRRASLQMKRIPCLLDIRQKLSDNRQNYLQHTQLPTLTIRDSRSTAYHAGGSSILHAMWIS